MFWPRDTAIAGFYIHQYDIRSHAANFVPGDDVVIPPSQQAKEPAGAGYHNGYDVTGAYLHAGIGDITQPPAVRYTDHFLAVQLRKFRAHPLIPPDGFGAVYAFTIR